MMTRLTGLISLACLLSPVALAQVGAGPSRASILELASTLGEAHAIRSLCNGETDQTWRDYMLQLQALEATDGGEKSQLTRAFNNGYKRQRASHDSCSPELGRVESEIAARGRALAETVARSYLE